MASIVERNNDSGFWYAASNLGAEISAHRYHDDVTAPFTMLGSREQREAMFCLFLSALPIFQ